MKYLILLALLASCAPPKDNTPDAQAAITVTCQVIDTCTYYNPFLKNPVYNCIEKNVSANPCLTTREDWHQEYQNGQLVPVQGPGPKAIQ